VQRDRVDVKVELAGAGLNRLREVVQVDVVEVDGAEPADRRQPRSDVAPPNQRQPLLDPHRQRRRQTDPAQAQHGLVGQRAVPGGVPADAKDPPPVVHLVNHQLVEK